MLINGKHITQDFLEQLLAQGEVYEKDLAAFLIKWLGEDDFIEVKTSGSTGLPKLIKHKKSAMLGSAKLTCDFLKLVPGMNALFCLSANNIAGMMMVVRAFERNMNLVTVAPGSHPLESVNPDTKVDFAAMVPAQVYNSLKESNQRQVLESITNLIIGGAPISFQMSQEIRKLPGKVYSTFGMTETISHVALQKLNGSDSSDEYTILQGISIDKGSLGNLIIRAPHLSSEPIITNDAVEITSEKTFKWLGRLDHVINSGGHKIYPEVVESKIAALMASLFPVGDGTRRYFIASLPDEKLGERLVLIVECPAIEESVSKLLIEKLRKGLPAHEVPKEVLCLPKFIETPTQKIIRSAIVKRIISNS